MKCKDCGGKVKDGKCVDCGYKVKADKKAPPKGKGKNPFAKKGKAKYGGVTGSDGRDL